MGERIRDNLRAALEMLADAAFHIRRDKRYTDPATEHAASDIRQATEYTQNAYKECDRLQAENARLREAAQAALEFVTGNNYALAPEAVEAQRRVQLQLQAALEEVPQ